MPTVTQYQIVFWLCLLGTVFLSLTPSIPGEQLFELQDKVGHTTIYAAAVFYLCAGLWASLSSAAVGCSASCIWFAGMEAAQSMTAYRQAEVLGYGGQYQWHRCGLGSDGVAETTAMIEVYRGSDYFEAQLVKGADGAGWPAGVFAWRRTAGWAGRGACAGAPVDHRQ